MKVISENNSRSLTQHIEPVDSEKGRVALAPGEYVERRMRESNISHDIRGVHEIDDLGRNQHRR